MNAPEPQRRLPLAIAPFGCCALAGALVWFASPMVTGQREPWDSAGPYYYLSLLVIGLVAGTVWPRSWWNSWLGVFAGQMIGSVATADRLGPLWPLGLILMLLFSLISLFGALVGACFRIVTARLFSGAR